MTLRISNLWLFLVCCGITLVAENLLPEQFFLTTYYRVKPRSNFETQLRQNEVGFRFQEYDFTSKPLTLSYVGSIKKPFSVVKPLELRHSLFTPFSMNNFTVAILSAITIQALSSRTFEQYYSFSGPIGSQKLSLRTRKTQTRYTQLNYENRLNASLQILKNYLTVAAGHTIFHQTGYSYTNQVLSPSACECLLDIQHYNPKDFSFGADLGVLLHGPLCLYYDTSSIIMGFQYQWKNVRIPLSVVRPSDFSRATQSSYFVAFNGSTHAQKESKFWIGMHSDNTNHLFSNRMFPLTKFFRRFTLGDLLYSKVTGESKNTLVRYLYDQTNKTIENKTTIITSQQTQEIAIITPIIYLTKNVYLSTPLRYEFFEKKWRPDSLFINNYQTSIASFAGSLNVRFLVQARYMIETFIRSGELALDMLSLQSKLKEKPRLIYESYKLRFGVSLSGML